MDKQVFYLRSPQIRQNLKTFIDSLQLNPDKPLALTIQEPTRSLEQNSKLWATLRDLIELINAFGAEHGVTFSDESRLAIEWAARYGDKKQVA